eukprot:Gb_00491 [translate_table: standard]
MLGKALLLDYCDLEKGLADAETPYFSWREGKPFEALEVARDLGEKLSGAGLLLEKLLHQSLSGKTRIEGMRSLFLHREVHSLGKIIKEGLEMKKVLERLKATAEKKEPTIAPKGEEDEDMFIEANLKAKEKAFLKANASAEEKEVTGKLDEVLNNIQEPDI